MKEALGPFVPFDLSFPSCESHSDGTLDERRGDCAALALWCGEVRKWLFAPGILSGTVCKSYIIKIICKPFLTLAIEMVSTESLFWHRNHPSCV